MYYDGIIPHFFSNICILDPHFTFFQYKSVVKKLKYSTLIESHIGFGFVFTLCERRSGQCYIDLRQQSVYQSALVQQICQTVNMVSGTDHPDCNSVEFLLQNSFERLSVSEEIVCLCLFC